MFHTVNLTDYVSGLSVMDEVIEGEARKVLPKSK